jgi:hypothetical protein
VISVVVRSVDGGQIQVGIPFRRPDGTLGRREEYFSRCSPYLQLTLDAIAEHLSSAIANVASSGKRRRVVLEVLP